MKSKDYAIVILIIIVVILVQSMLTRYNQLRTIERVDDLALALSQVNELADERSPIIGQINEVLERNGYSHLKRKIIVKKTEEE